MKSKSEAIKSKKQKMLNKKQQKTKDNEFDNFTSKLSKLEIIQLSSSNQDAVNQNLNKKEKVEKKDNKNNKDNKNLQVKDKIVNNHSISSNRKNDDIRVNTANNTHNSFDNNNSGQKYNNFDIKRLTKITGPLKLPSQPSILQIQQCFQTIPQSLTHTAYTNKTIAYKTFGINSMKTISENYLKQRLEKIPEQKPINTMIDPIESEAQEGQSQRCLIQQNALEVIKQQPQKPIKRIPRYFDQQISENSDQNSEKQDQNQQQQKQQNPSKKAIKCYRCGSKGHIARLCNMAQILKCVYCLGNHHSSQCSDKLCHKCNQKGHIKQQCKNDKIQCHRCRNYGHVSKNCGKIIMINFRSDREQNIKDRFQKQDLQKIKCLKCNGSHDSRGHFNCQTYPNKVPLIYDEPYLIQ